LTALREGRAPRLGGGRSRRVDVRLAAISVRDTDDAVRVARLRPDFAQRLAAVRIRLPSLRDRRDDIPALAAAFAARWMDRAREDAPPIGDDALERLTAFDWPGNLTELEAVMFEAVDAAGREPIEARHLPVSMRFSANADAGGDERLEDVERRHVLAVLDRCGGNKTRAAAVLGIDRRTLRERLRRWDTDA